MQSLTCSLSVLPLDSHYSLSLYFFSFFFNDTATTEIYTLSLHDALPISPAMRMYIARRFLHGLLVLWLVSLVIFSLVRSEEHTSELQSHSDLVCRLLLEKKKKRKQTTKASHNTESDATNGDTSHERRGVL